MDLDCDGVITPNEMQFFYEEQLHRMECMAQEPVLFEDIVCQMADMICPHVGVLYSQIDLSQTSCWFAAMDTLTQTPLMWVVSGEECQ